MFGNGAMTISDLCYKTGIFLTFPGIAVTEIPHLFTISVKKSNRDTTLVHMLAKVPGSPMDFRVTPLGR